MKIGLAQIKPAKGDIRSNLEKHLSFAHLAKSMNVNFLAFPELSLTGYEPTLAQDLAMDFEDPQLLPIQKFSDAENITIAIGCPVIADSRIKIGMIIFQPGASRMLYCKQQLHPDEFPFFSSGEEQLILPFGKDAIAPAICFESLQPNHAASAHQLGSSVYLASVAKSQTGIEKAKAHYPEMAKKYNMNICLVNAIGPCDDFECAGQSAVWNKNGALLAKLDQSVGLLIFDTQSNEVFFTSV